MTSEINPFKGQGRVVGLEDANWIIDFAVGGIYGLTRNSEALLAKAAVADGLYYSVAYEIELPNT